MNLIKKNETLTMSSREIAELVDSKHEVVLKTVRAMVAKGIVSANEATYTHPQNGQVYPEFILNYRDSLILASGYSAELRARIIDRWQELERQQAPSLPQTFADALRLAADQAERIEQQQKALLEAKPKVEFVDRYVTADTGSKGFRQVAKLLQIKEPEFRQFLTDNKIMYRLGGEWVPYQNHIEAGRFEVKAGVAGKEHAYQTARFTPKGIKWISGIIGTAEREN